MAEASHAADPLPPDISREHRTKPVPPQTNGLVADVDPALEQQVFDIAQRQREEDVHHNHEADDE